MIDQTRERSSERIRFDFSDTNGALRGRADGEANLIHGGETGDLPYIVCFFVTAFHLVGRSISFKWTGWRAVACVQRSLHSKRQIIFAAASLRSCFRRHRFASLISYRSSFHGNWLWSLGSITSPPASFSSTLIHHVTTSENSDTCPEFIYIVSSALFRRSLIYTLLIIPFRIIPFN